MATSQHWAQQQERQRQLVEELVLLFGLQRGTSNYKRAVRFAIANLGDSQFPYPAPTQVKARYGIALAKLELNSQLSKRQALADTLERLQARHAFKRCDWDAEEKLYGKLALIHHLSTSVTSHTEASDQQVALHKDRAAVAAELDDNIDLYAEQLRDLAHEWACAQDNAESLRDDSSTDELSGWSDEEEEGATSNAGQEREQDSSEKQRTEIETPNAAGMQPADKAERQRNSIQQCAARQACGHAGGQDAGHPRQVPLGMLLPLDDPTLVADAQNPCHLAMLCAQQQEKDAGEGAPRLWRNQHLVVHEQMVVREVLAMLLGSEGRLFGKKSLAVRGAQGEHGDAAGRADNRLADEGARGLPQGAGVGGDRKIVFYLRHRIAMLHLSPEALGRMLEDFLERAAVLEQLRVHTARVIRPDSTDSCTLQALCNSVHDHLAVIDSFLHELALHTSNDARVPLSSLIAGGARGSRGQTSLTLLVLNQMLKNRLEVVDILQEVVEGAQHRGGLAGSSPAQQAHQALTFLHTASARARLLPDFVRRLVLHRLFTATMEPYLRILETWLYEGSLADDKRAEFFIYARPLSELVRGLEDAERGNSDAAAEEEIASGGAGAASVYWQRFAIRVEGDVVQYGMVVACSPTHVQLDSSASTCDDCYSGLTLAVRVSAEQWESAIITSYNGAKRRAVVALSTMPAEQTEYVVSTIVPSFLRPIASRILAAGKSVNVLMLQQQTQPHVAALLSQRRCIVASFLDCMARSAPASDGWGIERLELDAALRLAMLTDADADEVLEQGAGWRTSDSEGDEENEGVASAATTMLALEQESVVSQASVGSLPVSLASSVVSTPCQSVGSSPAKSSGLSSASPTQDGVGVEADGTPAGGNKGVDREARIAPKMSLGAGRAGSGVGGVNGEREEGEGGSGGGDGEEDGVTPEGIGEGAGEGAGEGGWKSDEVRVGWGRGRGRSRGFDLSDLFFASLETANGAHDSEENGVDGDGVGEGMDCEEGSDVGKSGLGGNEGGNCLSCATSIPSPSLQIFLDATHRTVRYGLVCAEPAHGAEAAAQAEEGEGVGDEEKAGDGASVGGGQRQQQMDGDVHSKSSRASAADHLGGRARQARGLLGSELVPLHSVLDSALMLALQARVGRLNKIFVHHLMTTHHLARHLHALRCVFFMASGDVLHEWYADDLELGFGVWGIRFYDSWLLGMCLTRSMEMQRPDPSTLNPRLDTDT
jgi:hypothetical protein